MLRITALLLVIPPLAAAATCESLISTHISGAEVTSTSATPQYCQVKLTARPVPDSEIRVEVWLPPADKWNGKFVGTGNGGFSSALSLGIMRSAIGQGFAVAGSNTGHEGDDLKVAIGHPEKIKDWGYRATHVMTETAKQVVKAYYRRAAARAYFTGCSTGGHQALMESQRYPTDYDRIIAGDPGNNRIRLNVGFLWSWLAANKAPLPASKLPMITRAAVEACDALDGIQDGIISDPRRCKFDPAALQCKGGEDANCLTAAEVTTVRAIYDGAHNPRTGEPVFAGWSRGTETGWTAYFVGHSEPARLDFWRYWALDNPEWDPRTFDLDRDLAKADAKVGFIDANNPDLGAFRRHKGKLLMYHGWADPVAPPEETIRYFDSVAKAMGGREKIDSFLRLFMVPGMAHCSGGPGPNTFDTLGTLDQWVTTGAAPARIIASHSTNGSVDRTRPLCPYPQEAKWNRTGSSDDAAQFTCVNP